MESLFGIVGKDFVILGADCKVARSILVYKDDEDKMQTLDSHKIICGSGPQADRVEFCEYVQKNMKLYQLTNGVTLNGHATANFVRGELARRLRKAPCQLNALLGACDVDTLGGEKKVVPSLYWVDYLGTLAKLNYGAQGYGAHFCLSIMDREWRENLTLDEAKTILKHCDNELKERFLVRSGEWIYKVIDENGIRDITL
ncbi:proteasome subunit beta type-2 [Achlya hypogyna]|uniref:Proteasome subunit beta n=1 Tax=Achlya hypogyna TaxID=1202772 RepID=A0A1V9ZHC8_ACHHY|nr:proteasome subunit beta type-2 [Achlya hypogyna]